MPNRIATLLLRCAGIALLLAALGGCSSLPKIDRAAIASEAIELSTNTTLGRLAKSGPARAEATGFRLMPLGTFSLDARIQLARRAEASLDVQYYHFENDWTGRYLLRAHARRGRARRAGAAPDRRPVHRGADPLFLSFAAHKNVQVRLFNPFVANRAAASRALHGPSARLEPRSTTGCTTSSSSPTARSR